MSIPPSTHSYLYVIIIILQSTYSINDSIILLFNYSNQTQSMFVNLIINPIMLTLFISIHSIELQHLIDSPSNPILGLLMMNHISIVLMSQ